MKAFFFSAKVLATSVPQVFLFLLLDHWARYCFSMLPWLHQFHFLTSKFSDKLNKAHYTDTIQLFLPIRGYFPQEQRYRNTTLYYTTV